MKKTSLLLQILLFSLLSYQCYAQRIIKHSDFRDSVFTSTANFSRAQFASTADFSYVRFISDIEFYMVTLPKYLDLSNITKIANELDLTTAIIKVLLPF